jgi:hypothetical protein
MEAPAAGATRAGCARRLVRLISERGKGVGLTAVAVARELAGFCWELAISD